jgi:uncharacterized FAD-dependent dehydrogenase
MDPMPRLTQLRLPIDHDADALPRAIRDALGIAPDDLLSWTIARRGHDARRRGAMTFVYTIDVVLRPGTPIRPDARLTDAPDTRYRPLTRAPAQPATRPVVIGCGPCGLLAALVLAEMGFRPIILERGRIVRERTKDTWGLWRRGVLNPESNVQFGEGGAGTFSDGKLYSGIKDPRHLGRKVLTEFVAAGAPEEILYVSKPHIGTFRLVTVVEGMREKILALGGEYRFGARVVDFDIAVAPDGARAMRGVVLADGETLLARGVRIEPKPFSIGFRIEHPQALIDRARFGMPAHHPLLGAADYKLVHHAANGRSVYSFCMCPGGRVVAAASEPGGVVTNGMSQYSRAEFNANAGIVVGITPADYPDGPLAGVALQRALEARAFVAGGGTYAAPVQLVGDFLAGRASVALGSVTPSYRPAVTPTDLAGVMPGFVIEAIREALPAFERQVPGFAMADAVLTGVETRTSSPVRIRRDAVGQSVNTRGLFPAGEGCGYAGGILSAAVDGIRIAEAVAAAMTGGALPESVVRESVIGGDAMVFG